MSGMSSKHIPILDGMRAYAVLMVCICHFFPNDEIALYNANKYLGIFLFKLSDAGNKGVELFFLLSGFLITGILLDSKNSARYFRTFYLRRFIRIFPLYYFILVISFFILPNFLKIDHLANLVIQKQIWLWTYTSNLSEFFGKWTWNTDHTFPWFGHFWSLCVEEHFYIFWPLLIYFANEKWLPRIMWSIVVISLFSILFVYFSGYSFPILKWSTIRYAGVLSLGGLLALYKKDSVKWNKMITVSKNFIVPSAILFFIIIFIPRKYELYDVLKLLLSVPLFIFLIVLSIDGRKIPTLLFKHKFLYFLGKISYGIYVFHYWLRPYFEMYIYNNLRHFISNGIILASIYTVICISISIFIAWLSWIMFESQVLKLKKYFNY